MQNAAPDSNTTREATLMSAAGLQRARVGTRPNVQVSSSKRRRRALGSESKPSQRIRNQWTTRVNHALRNLGDRGQLNSNPLARLAYVEKLAETEYGGKLLPRGLALRSIISACIDKIVTELGAEPGLGKSCEYLKLSSMGLTCEQIASELKLSREHVSRFYRPRALELLTEQFMAVIEEGNGPAPPGVNRLRIYGTSSLR